MRAVQEVSSAPTRSRSRPAGSPAVRTRRDAERPRRRAPPRTTKTYIAVGNAAGAMARTGDPELLRSRHRGHPGGPRAARGRRGRGRCHPRGVHGGVVRRVRPRRQPRRRPAPRCPPTPAASVCTTTRPSASPTCCAQAAPGLPTSISTPTTATAWAIFAADPRAAHDLPAPGRPHAVPRHRRSHRRRRPGRGGRAVNVALPPGTRDAGWLRALTAVVPALLRSFAPGHRHPVRVRCPSPRSAWQPRG